MNVMEERMKAKIGAATKNIREEIDCSQEKWTTDKSRLKSRWFPSPPGSMSTKKR
jgi:hypothetical protein